MPKCNLYKEGNCEITHKPCEFKGDFDKCSEGAPEDMTWADAERLMDR